MDTGIVVAGMVVVIVDHVRIVPIVVFVIVIRVVVLGIAVVVVSLGSVRHDRRRLFRSCLLDQTTGMG